MRAGVKEKCGWNNKIAHDKFEITTKKSKVKTKIQNFLHFNTRAISSSKLSSEFGRENELDGCYHVYLDVGSNVGVQVRKLFEPDLYPDAPVLEVFNSVFGPRNKTRSGNHKPVFQTFKFYVCL
jgi:hypothetical protein